MLTISRLSRWSIAYYEKTANEAKQASMDRVSAGGGLGEYYSEADTRVPTWMVAGDAAKVAELTGLSAAAVAGGFADGDEVTTWLDDGISPAGVAGRTFGKNSVHGFDLTFAAPKSVSLLRAMTSEINEKVVAEAHRRAVKAALDYLHEHAGYTRVHNPLTGKKDMQRLPGLATIAYQHETSRCGDPHLHTHVILPNRQARADGEMVSIDSKSLYHEAKAAGIIYQAVLRHELHAERGVEWAEVDQHSGMAEIAGITKACIKAWSRQSTRLREWAHNNLIVVDGAPTAEQLQIAQKATRPAKPESKSWAELNEDWRADARGFETDRAAHREARRARRAAPRILGDRAALARAAARIDKSAFTRADLVELVGAQLPVDAEGDPRAHIDMIVDAVAVRVSAPREANHREGHELFTVDAVIAEEVRIFNMVDAADNYARMAVDDTELGDLSPDQARAIGAIASSPFLVQPLQAPAGAGKTHSLKALRAAAHRDRKHVLVVAPTGKAVDEAMREEAGDQGLTVAKALNMIEAGELHIDRRTVLVIDEASMLGTPELKKLMSSAIAGKAKMVLVGDAYQLSPVKARGGMFEYLCDELPWSQRLGEVWRMRDTEERDTSLALRSAHGNRLRNAVGWYRNRDRLHTGDPIAMADDAVSAYTRARDDGHDAAILCDKWEIANAINVRLHRHYTDPEAATVRVARDQHVSAGDIIISRLNDATIQVGPGANHKRGERIDQVRNGNRWRVAFVDQKTGQIGAERLTDQARVLFEGDYRKEHVTLGYATTLHAAQGITVGDSTTHGACFTVLSDKASRAMAYVGMTRGKDENHAFIYQPITGERDHEHTQLADGDDLHILRRGNKHAAAHYFRMILGNDDRPRTMHAEAERVDRDQLPTTMQTLLDKNDQRRAHRTRAWQKHRTQERSREAAYDRIITSLQRSASGREQSVDGDGLEL